MAMQKRNLNTVYISERLRESLRPISHCALTTVVAPMGYVKTTAVNWYLSQRASEAARIIRVSVYSDNLAIFWQSVQSAFCHGGLSFLSGYPCPADAAGGSLLADELCHRLAGETEFFIFLDDFHLLTDGRIPGFLCTLAGRLPENVHIIAASRDRFLPRDAVLRLGRRACSIGIQQLRLNHTELAVYTRRCGIRLTDRQVDDLLYTTEGWFSAVYLNLCSLADRGQLPSHASDIYDMFTAAMLDPLPPEQQEFLAVLGLADEFTADMAEFVTENAQTRALLTGLTEQNAFAQRLPDSETFRFHHMMKSCAQRLFQTLPSQKQAQYLHRYAAWYEQHGQYIHALSAYRRCGDFDDALRVIQRDAGILLAALEPAQVLSFLETCPTQVLKRHPFSLLVLMRRMFTWRQIPKMMELKALLLAAVEEDTALTEAERGNLLGECDLILSFLSYNDISAMSRLHRSASRQMSRPAISIKASGGWTFGSPSVLMMFHREPGALPRELAEMDECMPHYYQVTSGHGQGAETVMRAEAAFLQGRFADAQIDLERTYARIAHNGQENMALCCDFLSWRLALCADIPPRDTFARRREVLLAQHNTDWLHILDSISAYCHALARQPERIPALFREHRLSTVNFLAPGKPMMDLIENQVFLAQGSYAQVIGRSEALLDTCLRMHYALVALYVRLQTAAAYLCLDKPRQAQPLLLQALEDAAQDGFILPLAENYHYLRPMLAQLPQEGLLPQAIALGEEMENRLRRAAEPAALAALTPREKELAALIAQRFSNREIAQKLYLSEGSVKQYTSQLYAKLGLQGDARTKRRRLADLAKY